MEKNIISQQFDFIADRYPDRIALKCGNYSANYRKMKIQVQIISNNLRMRGVKPGDLVAICLPHSELFVLSVMAVLKCGATYVPMEENTPDGRIRIIVENNNIDWIISNREHKVQAEYIDYDDVVVDKGVENKDYCLVEEQTEDDSAYIIFTSGSTGVPKGIEIKNFSVCKLVESYGKYLNSTSVSHQVLLMASFCFDMSVFQMFYPLLTGQTLNVLPDYIKENPMELLEYINDHEISVMDVTPLYLDVMMECMQMDKEYRIPDYIVSSGEALPIMTAKRWFSIPQCQNSTILNSYGPTEACVYASVFELNQFNVSKLDKMVIGKPLDGYQIYILNENQEVCRSEEAGELYIAGTGLAKGYRNLPELTKQAFIQEERLFDGTRLYRTGDFGYYTKEGMLFYLGREGDQVKIHGYRIELGEIEYQIQNIPGITKCRVIADGDGKDKKIIAYFLPEEGYSWTAEELDNCLKDTLPHYMLPQYYVPVNEFKKTERGKLERKSLPDYLTHMLKRQKNQDVPIIRDDVLNSILDICRSILTIEEINPDISFLEHGGTSIHYFLLSAMLQSKLNVLVSPSVLMNMPDIYSIANAVRELHVDKSEVQATNIVNDNPIVSGTTAFQRLLFTEEKKTEKLVKKYGMEDFPMYNVIYSVCFDEEIDENKFRLALEKVIEENDALRSCVIKNADNIYEMKLQNVNVDNCFEVLNVDSVENKAIDREIIKKFDISCAPLFKITMLIDKKGGQRFVMDFHHAVFDYCSMRIFMEDLLCVYYNKEREKTGSFLAYINNVHQINKESDIRFWKQYYQDRKPSVFLTGDISQYGIHNMTKFATKSFRVDYEQYKRVCDRCKKMGATVYGFMFAFFANLIMSLTGCKDIVIGTYMNSRAGEALTNMRTIGLITSMVGIRFKDSSDMTLEDLVCDADSNLKEVGNHLLLGYNDVYGIMDEKDLIQGKLFDMVFNYIVQGSIYDGISKHKYSFKEIGEEPISLPLALKGFEDATGITFKLKYCSEIYSEMFIDKFVARFIDNIESVIKERE